MAVPPGWYPAADSPGELRYWDGEAWTEYRQPDPASLDDLPPPPAAPLDDLPPPPTQVLATGGVDLAAFPPPGADQQAKEANGEPQDGHRALAAWILGGLALAAIAVWFLALNQGGGSATSTAAKEGDDAGELDQSPDPTVSVTDETSDDDVADESNPSDDGAATTTTTTTTTTTSTTTTTTAPPTTTTVPGPPERAVTLLVDVAKLRTQPSLGAAEVDTITDLGGATIIAVGEPLNGWYEVRIGFQQGWMFGAFILPPADGLIVAQTKSETPATLRNSSGQELSISNASGSYVLATNTDGTLWPIILPEGGTAYVRGADMKIRS